MPRVPRDPSCRSCGMRSPWCASPPELAHVRAPRVVDCCLVQEQEHVSTATTGTMKSALKARSAAVGACDPGVCEWVSCTCICAAHRTARSSGVLTRASAIAGEAEDEVTAATNTDPDGDAVYTGTGTPCTSERSAWVLLAPTAARGAQHGPARPPACTRHRRGTRSTSASAYRRRGRCGCRAAA